MSDEEITIEIVDILKYLYDPSLEQGFDTTKFSYNYKKRIGTHNDSDFNFYLKNVKYNYSQYGIVFNKFDGIMNPYSLDRAYSIKIQLGKMIIKFNKENELKKINNNSVTNNTTINVQSSTDSNFIIGSSNNIQQQIQNTSIDPKELQELKEKINALQSESEKSNTFLDFCKNHGYSLVQIGLAVSSLF